MRDMQDVRRRVEPQQRAPHLLEEGAVASRAGAREAVRGRRTIDAGLIAAAQRVEHYEIAAYGTVRAFARQLNNEYVAELFEQTLDEEKATDQLLTSIAERAVNPASI